MPKRTKKRMGRPRETQRARPGEYVGFRAPKELKDRLERAAAAANRSLSTEAQVRLEHSFIRQDHLLQALCLTYGDRAAGLLLLIGRAMANAGWWADQYRPVTDHIWLDDPYAFDQVRQAIIQVLDLARPEGDPIPPPPIPHNLDPVTIGFYSARVEVGRNIENTDSPTRSNASLPELLGSLLERIQTRLAEKLPYRKV
jgi:hypothetical protein